MNISELLRARSFLVLVELRFTSWEKRLPFCWTGMSAFGTKQTYRDCGRESAFWGKADINQPLLASLNL
jgi:hypothetical protein